MPFDPTTGNDPLHFGSSNRPLTECPSLENTAENSKKRKITGLTSDANMNMAPNSMTMPMSDPSVWAQAMSSLGMPPLNMTGQQLMPAVSEGWSGEDRREEKEMEGKEGRVKRTAVAPLMDHLEKQLGTFMISETRRSSSPQTPFAPKPLKHWLIAPLVMKHKTWLPGLSAIVAITKANVLMCVSQLPQRLLCYTLSILIHVSLLTPDFDPSLGLMTGITPINPMMPGLGLAPPPLSQDAPVVKEIIHCNSCTLFPPNHSKSPLLLSLHSYCVKSRTTFITSIEIIVSVFFESPCLTDLLPPATRERPPGGDIAAIRKSKKNFCHIRFAEEFTVDKALLLSGYRIRLGSSTDKKDSGRLHVDFAQARDDLYEWECHQRMLAREERHRRKIEEDLFRPPSPPPIAHYSEHECSELGDRIKEDGKFPEAVRVLLTWLERGEVNRRNANNFYSMIQASNGHIRRLTGEKSQHEKEVEEAKEKFKTAMVTILGQFEQIVSVFHAASKQKAWDHFSKAQRKNLDLWRTQVEKIRNMHNEQLMGIRGEEEMEMSDDDMEDCSATNSKDSEDSGVSQAEALKEENDSLRCQLDAYRNEVELLKQEQGKNQPMISEEDNTRSQQLSFLQQALQGMQKQLLRMRDELKEREAELQKSMEEKQQLKNQIHDLKSGLHNLQPTHTSQDVTASSVVSCSQDKEALPEKNPLSPVNSERDALLIGIISTFLNVHPFGASMEYICSYLQRLDTKAGAERSRSESGETLELLRLPGHQEHINSAGEEGEMTGHTELSQFIVLDDINLPHFFCSVCQPSLIPNPAEDEHLLPSIGDTKQKSFTAVSPLGSINAGVVLCVTVFKKVLSCYLLYRLVAHYQGFLFILRTISTMKHFHLVP
ncbi:hypothetical protein F7725_010431 [Dissostichus mawsoni]|uniref:Ecto-NOX disulfide-thiol exchanger 1/2 domain-containing protein n=1 Tax=Dissostichus mawsoni TaxID=36200 RepID=A0A7J5XP68_DISMA|nr:hypothetical protein F7725_010431 [Dissostichus mawsoni]